MGTFGTRIALQNCPKLGQEGWAFILASISHRRPAALPEKGMTLDKVEAAAEATP